MRSLMLGLAASLALAATADAATYFGHRTVGTAVVDLTIITDDTLGVLTEDNILDWSVKVANNGQTAVFGANDDGARLDIGGSAFTADLGGLYFDFGAAGNNYAAFVSAFRQSYCVQSNGCFDYNGPEEIAVAGQFVTNFQIIPQSGRQQIAAVPEPGAWALMLLGFGAAGAMLRDRRRALAG
ncbi:PEPxxWA-CTERM sorting domain-containing protein [Phenylobacterium sp.]|uniref:PEPxxWA-CTERM sorting domain-containing protein n=1 Tax=Phenylobacterium sp. TaxID=1871053 RepID=UPI0025D7DF5D|nr:PEPxxWA-CTERM sorting domain-containing protein [Phenylobacterium sp.]